MNRQKTLVISSLCLLMFLTCGLEEHYYLPQVPESGIITTLNTGAVINIPSNLLSNVAHYATGYVIFYRIYISSSNNDTTIDIITHNSSISNDYYALNSYTDPSNVTTTPSSTTFSDRRFYELELAGTNIRNTVLSKSGGTFNIQFQPIPGRHPVIAFNGNEYSLLRSNGGGTFNPRPTDRYFFSSPDLNNFANAVSTINADVSGQNGVSEHAYVSMYIVAVGQNPSNFSRLYGKPTHISIFKLPSIN